MAFSNLGSDAIQRHAANILLSALCLGPPQFQSKETSHLGRSDKLHKNLYNGAILAVPKLNI